MVCNTVLSGQRIESIESLGERNRGQREREETEHWWQRVESKAMRTPKIQIQTQARA